MRVAILATGTRGAWTTPTTIAEGPSIFVNWADVPSVARQDDGTLVAHWAEKSAAEPYAYDVVLARSTDGGATWKRLGKPHADATTTEHGFVSLVPDGDAVLALWLDGRATAGGGEGAMTLRSARIGETIGASRNRPKLCPMAGDWSARQLWHAGDEFVTAAIFLHRFSTAVSAVVPHSDEDWSHPLPYRAYQARVSRSIPMSPPKS